MIILRNGFFFKDKISWPSIYKYDKLTIYMNSSEVAILYQVESGIQLVNKAMDSWALWYDVDLPKSNRDFI